MKTVGACHLDEQRVTPHAEMSRPSEPTPSTLLPALRTHHWFASCPPDFQAALVERSRLWKLAPGEHLFERGGTPDGLCCVTAGALRVGAVQADGTRSMIFVLEPYQWFGEISMLDGLARTHDAVADVDSTVLVVPQTDLHAWLEAHPPHWRDLARLACGKLRMAFTVLEDLTRLPLEQRLAKHLLLALSGFGDSAAPTRTKLRLPQEQLALMMGVSRQTMNKALRTLEANGAIALHYAEIELRDADALRRLAPR